METKPYVELPTSLGSEIIKPEDIISIQAMDKCIIVAIENQDDRQVKLSFGRAATLFNHPFMVQCHRSHLINVLKIREILYKQKKIKLKNGKFVPISKSCKKDFEQCLSAWCQNHKNCGGGNSLITSN